MIGCAYRGLGSIAGGVLIVEAGDIEPKNASDVGQNLRDGCSTEICVPTIGPSRHQASRQLPNGEYQYGFTSCERVTLTIGLIDY